MKDLSLIEIAVENAVVATSDAFVVGATAHELVLYSAAQVEGHWLQTGNLRPFEPEASIADIVARAYAWISELEDQGQANVDFMVDAARIRMAGVTKELRRDLA